MCLKILAFCQGISGQLALIESSYYAFSTFAMNQKSDLVLCEMVEIDEDKALQAR